MGWIMGTIEHELIGMGQNRTWEHRAWENMDMEQELDEHGRRRYEQ
jgi:hypothetical protein